MASLANFTTRMLILHPVLSIEYFCKISGILFSCALSISEEARSWNLGLVGAIATSSGTSIGELAALTADGGSKTGGEHICGAGKS